MGIKSGTMAWGFFFDHFHISTWTPKQKLLSYEEGLNILHTQ